jgi:hypothetical protein
LNILFLLNIFCIIITIIFINRRIEEKQLLEKKQKEKDMKRVRQDILLSKGDKEI